MIRRSWHSRTTPEQADRYETLLRERIFPGITARGIAGLHGLEAWRREVDGGVEFVTVMSFVDLDAVTEFTGGDPERSVVPAEARALLADFDEHSQHHELVITAR